MYINADMHAILFLFKPSLIFIRDRIGSVGNLVVVEEIVKKKENHIFKGRNKKCYYKKRSKKIVINSFSFSIYIYYILQYKKTYLP